MIINNATGACIKKLMYDVKSVLVVTTYTVRLPTKIVRVQNAYNTISGVLKIIMQDTK